MQVLLELPGDDPPDPGVDPPELGVDPLEEIVDPPDTETLLPLLLLPFAPQRMVTSQGMSDEIF